MSLFRKGLSDPLVQATNNILTAKPKFSVGDDVIVNQGPNTGRDGTVVGIKSTGYSNVQLTQGRHITISNEYLGTSSNLLTEKKKLDPSEKKKNGKNGEKEKVEINPDLDEIQDHQRRANIIQSSRAISLIRGIIGNR